ncbi:MAG: hypothetical protein ABW221_07910 [Vicinamibacteria bacterium]
MSHASRGLAALGVSAGLLTLAAAPAAAQPSPPIVHEGDVGAACGLAILGISTVPLVLIGPVPLGRTIVVTTKAGGTGLLPTLVVDSSGINLYGPDVTHSAPGSAVSIFSSRVTSPLTIAQVITLTFNNTTGLVQTVCTTASVFSGLQTTAGWLDQSATNGSASTVSALSVTTGATTQPNELLIGAFSTGNAGTFTLGAGLTALTPACNVANSCLRPFYRVLSATGAQSASASGTTPTAWSAAVGTFRGEDFPVTLETFSIE